MAGKKSSKAQESPARYSERLEKKEVETQIFEESIAAEKRREKARRSHANAGHSSTAIHRARSRGSNQQHGHVSRPSYDNDEEPSGDHTPTKATLPEDSSYGRTEETGRNDTPMRTMTPEDDDADSDSEGAGVPPHQAQRGGRAVVPSDPIPLDLTTRGRAPGRPRGRGRGELQ